MTKHMLIDAAHAEETRVAVVSGNRIEELDFEIASRRQLRGNIYLAKVVRVEPSLQAAFVEYGGNRHGFLAFNEIHPDYYQIPHADREALMRDMAEDNGRDDHRDDHHEDEDEAASGASSEEGGEPVEGEVATSAEAVTHDDDDVMEQELERRRRKLMRRYKIQEVIRRRQIMLVQVVKEERGNKGAALTTYLSLAGRYSVLMPNTARGGGISRKIDNSGDRKRLKAAVQSLDVPAGMGLIVRTAGAERTKTEIKRDYDYLLRLWESIRETTLKSIAPAQIYAEEDLVKRAIRDMYDKDIDTIEVEGEAGYREARDFMRMIMPTHAKKVIKYDGPTPLFVRHRIEDQLAQIHSPIVPLKSGGYLVINQTEALVAVDVNSGRATRERNIETTAFKTNMEAAEETTRQLRLRDLAGLIVIDFIDMDEGKNNRAVEKKLRDCLAEDRARVQMGKISVFGLMEISRQRRRMGVLEGATNVCATCHGVGRVRSVESSALSALRSLDVEGSRGAGSAILKLPADVALYVLNCKRGFLSRLEDVHGLAVTVAVDDHLANGEHAIERTETREGPPRVIETAAPVALLPEADMADEDVFEVEEDEEEIEAAAPRREAQPRRDDGEPQGAGAGRSRRRRRRGGRGRDDRPVGEGEARDIEAGSDDAVAVDATDAPRLGAETEELDADGKPRRRRRGRRGGRRMREEGDRNQPYGWTEPGRIGAGDDPYAWRDPLALRQGDEAQAGAEQQTYDTGETRSEQDSSAFDDATEIGVSDSGMGETAPMPGPQVEAPAGESPYTWDTPEALGVEPPVLAEEPAPKPKRVRTRKPKAAVLDLVGDAEPQAAVPADPEPAPIEAEAPEQAPVVEAEEVPLVAADIAPPPPPPEPDPNEILAPPAEPKRGWWRRR